MKVVAFSASPNPSIAARDFTYIDAIVGALDHPPATGGHRMLNICDSHPGLMEKIEALEDPIAHKAQKVIPPMQPGDVTAT